MKNKIITDICNECETYYKLGEKHGTRIGFLLGIVTGTLGILIYTLL